MSDLENQEFRECAEQFVPDEFRDKGRVVACVARAMRIAADEALEMCKQSTYLAGGNGAIRQMKSSSVASRISSRIKGEK